MRTCCGCRCRKEKKELVRLYLDEAGQVLTDDTGKAGGRGVYVCRDPACVRRAFKTGAIARGLRTNVTAKALQSAAALLEEDFQI